MPHATAQVDTATRPLDWKHHPEPLEGRRVLVTGGTTGIGRATVLLLSHLAAKVAFFGTSPQHLDDTLADLERAGLKAHGFLADNADPDRLRDVFEQVDHTLGGLDVLINNAGVPADSIADTPIAEAHRVLEVNLLGYLACSRFATQLMTRDDRPGHRPQIINVGSMSAESVGPDSDIYVATKSGIRGFTLSLSKQLAPRGVRVTLLEPALTGTDFFSGEKGEPSNQRELEASHEMLTAEDLAESIAFCLRQPPRVNVVMMQVRQSAGSS